MRQPAAIFGSAIFLLAATLKHHHGEQYDVYRNNVPGWLPRLTPWQGSR